MGYLKHVDGQMTDSLVQWLQTWSQLTFSSGAAVARIFFIGSFILFPRTVLCLGVGALFGCAVIPIVLLSRTAGGIIAFLLARHLLPALYSESLIDGRVYERSRMQLTAKVGA